MNLLMMKMSIALDHTFFSLFLKMDFEGRINVWFSIVRLLIIVPLIGFCSYHTGAQQVSIYKLESDLKELHGFERLLALNRLSDHYLPLGSRKALRYSRQAVNLADNLFPTKSASDSIEVDAHIRSNFLLGQIYFDREVFFESRESLMSARVLSEHYRSDLLIDDIDRYLLDIEDMIESGKIKEGLLSKAFSDLNIGNTLKEASTDLAVKKEIRAGKKAAENGEFSVAIDHYNEAIDRMRDLGDLEGISELQIQIALMLDSLDQHTEASEFLEAAIKDAEHPSLASSIASDTLRQEIILPADTSHASEISAVLREEKENIKEMADEFARTNNYEKSLEYYKLYEKLSQKIRQDSIQQLESEKRRTSELLLLKQQTEIADLREEII